MVNPVQIKSLIDSSLRSIDLYSEDASKLVYNTGLVESKYEYIEQIKGPARGFFQCEPWVAVDICLNYLKYRKSLMKAVSDASYIDIECFLAPKTVEWEHLLKTNLSIQIIFCRLHYRRIPKKLPKTLKEQAKYWKLWYNTLKGKGTVDHFINIVESR